MKMPRNVTPIMPEKEASPIAARTRFLPSNSSSRAYSTIGIAFFAERPTSTMRPICVKMLLSPRPPYQTLARAVLQERAGSPDSMWWLQAILTRFQRCPTGG